VKIVLETYYGNHLVAMHAAAIHPVPGLPNVIQIDVKPRVSPEKPRPPKPRKKTH